MNPIAVYVGTTVIYWNSIVIALCIAACLALTLALYTANNGSGAAVWVFFPPALVFGVVFSRFFHWYCHGEQYVSLFRSLTDYSNGSFCMPGMLLGVWLAAYIVRRLGYTDGTARLLDSAAPGLALLIAFIRLSAVFTNSCRGKIVVTTKALQHLPLAVGVKAATGETEYVFATFFVLFLLMLVLFVGIMIFYVRRNNLPMKKHFDTTGHTARMFLLFYSAAELFLDSTRNDSSFIHFRFLTFLNKFTGFISFVQIASAVSILCILIYYSKRSVRANGLRPWHWLMWGGYFLTLVGVGVSEYLVQRYAARYMSCYSVMSVCCLLMAVDTYIMYRTVCAEE